MTLSTRAFTCQLSAAGTAGRPLCATPKLPGTGERSSVPRLTGPEKASPEALYSAEREAQGGEVPPARGLGRGWVRSQVSPCRWLPSIFTVVIFWKLEANVFLDAWR